MSQTKQDHYNDLVTIIEWLKENFPMAFPRDSKSVKPLELGIIEEIFEFYSRLDTPPFSKKRIRAAVGFYTLSPAYLLAQRTGTCRVDLYGNEVTTVTAEQAAYAQTKYQLRYGNKKNAP